MPEGSYTTKLFQSGIRRIAQPPPDEEFDRPGTTVATTPRKRHRATHEPLPQFRVYATRRR